MFNIGERLKISGVLDPRYAGLMVIILGRETNTGMVRVYIEEPHNQVMWVRADMLERCND